MEIEEYRAQFIDQLRFDADHEGTEPETQFILKTLEELESIGEFNDPMPMSIEMRGKRGRIMAFDAYAYDEADSALILIASDFTNERDAVNTLTNTRIVDLYTHMCNFLDEVVNGKMSDYCDDSDPAIILAKEFRKKIGKGLLDTEILRFKFYIISNSILSKQVKSEVVSKRWHNLFYILQFCYIFFWLCCFFLMHLATSCYIPIISGYK
ncbi:MAG: hypothetical protein ACLSBJ_03895 [Bacteroides xylanisolvens]|uniref:hypothetical protein n=1 Tax=Bacteroides sp. TaxID=29523 RepID=UPI00399165D0